MVTPRGNLLIGEVDPLKIREVLNTQFDHHSGHLPTPIMETRVQQWVEK